ncbi:hypothetical protein GCM10011363_42430 [Marivita lacus]|uniref:Uncharacterized protein n=1 Tax=Marivita lacus TaxID=1323742 RepID=A0ABQ1LAK8_9RHOB|nr:hypothetical protein GCM10011363_42430 [Marivita lacus]
MPHHFSCKDRLPALRADDMKLVMEAMGPMPRKALTAMVDYGLSDVEISRYYSVPLAAVTSLRHHFGIADDR